MSPQSTHIAGPWPDRLKGALPIIVESAAFWAIAATLLFFLVPGLETYPRLLVFTECATAERLQQSVDRLKSRLAERVRHPRGATWRR